MADFETKLRWLSERGNPAGAEELIERIEADMAGDPLVVVAKRREGTLMTETQQRPRTRPPSRYRGPVWAVTAFIAVLAVAAVFFAFSGDDSQVADTTPTPTTVAPDVETMTDLEIIEAGVDALYSGDAERAVELFERSELRGEDLGGSYDLIGVDGWIRRQAAYQATIDGRLTLDCTQGITPGEFTCSMLYHNALTDAVGGVDAEDPWESPVTVQDGVITEFYVPVIEFMLDEAGGFLGDQRIDGYEDCIEEVGSRLLRTAQCANLFMVHFDEWVAWCGRIVSDPEEIFASRCERE